MERINCSMTTREKLKRALWSYGFANDVTLPHTIPYDGKSGPTKDEKKNLNAAVDAVLDVLMQVDPFDKSAADRFAKANEAWPENAISPRTVFCAIIHAIRNGGA